MSKKLNYLKKYFSYFNRICNNSVGDFKGIIDSSEIIKNIKKKNKKITIIGNGGSASIANHVFTDLTKNLKIKTFNPNESSLITCFSNDYNYENWQKEILKVNLDQGDLLIAISSSGNSENILRACKIAKQKKCKVITFSGFEKNNKLRRVGNINFWVNSLNYNIIENIHQIIILSIIDLLSKKKIK
jgi:D-sedoheptulose 7-phosphate isomerase